MFDLDEEHDAAHDLARVALRESVTDRFQRAIGELNAVAYSIDSAVAERP